MFANCISTTTYSVSFSFETLEKYLDPSFLDLLLKELHAESLKESHVHVDYVNDGLTFSTIRGAK